MKTPIQPLGDRVVAVREEAKTQTASGLYLPDSSKEKPEIAEIVAVGTGVKHVKVGDRVLHDKYNVTEVKVDGEEFLIINEEYILATVN
ncbi:MAG: co-chaperone GroES [Candidatus Saccharibacteria bacterium]|nr:co-chaperone GroES [Candidatus Saccharibacteria bacterium]